MLTSMSTSPTMTVDSKFLHDPFVCVSTIIYIMSITIRDFCIHRGGFSNHLNNIHTDLSSCMRHTQRTGPIPFRCLHSLVSQTTITVTITVAIVIVNFIKNWYLNVPNIKYWYFLEGPILIGFSKAAPETSQTSQGAVPLIGGPVGSCMSMNPFKKQKPRNCFFILKNFFVLFLGAPSG